MKWILIRCFIYQALLLLKIIDAKAASVHYGRCSTENYGRGLCKTKDNCEFYAKDSVNLQNEQHCNSEQRGDLICCPNNRNAIPSFAVRVLPPTPLKNLTAADVLPSAPNCGSVLAERIYGGKQTLLREFAWTALIQYTNADGSKSHNCGGSLIAQRWVLTAAHCVLPQFLALGTRVTGVRLGEWDRTKNPDCFVNVNGVKTCTEPVLEVSVDRVIPHDNFDQPPSSYAQDIALLRLSRAIDWKLHDNVEAICLPLDPNVRDDLLVKAKVDITGWGRTEERNLPSNIKRKATLDVLNLETCKVLYRENGYTLVESQMCASGGRGVDSCSGDSGGPLMMIALSPKRYNYYYVAGIVSFGKERCGEDDFPAIYTRIGAFVDWIQNTIEDNV